VIRHASSFRPPHSRRKCLRYSPTIRSDTQMTGLATLAMKTLPSASAGNWIPAPHLITRYNIHWTMSHCCCANRVLHRICNSKQWTLQWAYAYSFGIPETLLSIAPRSDFTTTEARSECTLNLASWQASLNRYPGVISSLLMWRCEVRCICTKIHGVTVIAVGTSQWTIGFHKRDELSRAAMLRNVSQWRW
jgi:hypothetical protein